MEADLEAPRHELTSTAVERQLEQGLMDQIVRTLQELATGFAFVGRQIHFDVGGDDFYGFTP